MPKCKNCLNKFEVKYFNQKYCMEIDECIIAHVEFVKDKNYKENAKDKRQNKKEAKEKLKSKSEWLAQTQRVFNRYINLRDKGKPCISCNCKVDVPHASHYFSVGSCPNLRFNEDNVHTSCVKCNLHLHGNISEYSIMLPKKIGQENFNKLMLSRSISKNYHIHELIDLIKIYTEKIKNIK